MGGSRTGLGSRAVRARRDTGVWIMQCPQCGAETPDEEWNCVSCRINVYWASQHFEALAGIRQRLGLGATAATPLFLLRAHASAMDYRADRGGKVEHKVRQIARRVMRGEARDPAGGAAEVTAGSRAGGEPGWKQPGVASPSSAGGGGAEEAKETTGVPGGGRCRRIPGAA